VKFAVLGFETYNFKTQPTGDRVFTIKLGEKEHEANTAGNMRLAVVLLIRRTMWRLSLAEKNQNAEGYNNNKMSGNHLSDNNNRFLGPRAAAKRNPNKKRQTE
jgi:hypothetical protein